MIVRLPHEQGALIESETTYDGADPDCFSRRHAFSTGVHPVLLSLRYLSEASEMEYCCQRFFETIAKAARTLLVSRQSRSGLSETCRFRTKRTGRSREEPWLGEFVSTLLVLSTVQYADTDFRFQDARRTEQIGKKTRRRKHILGIYAQIGPRHFINSRIPENSSL